MIDTVFKAARRGLSVLFDSDTLAFSLNGPGRLRGFNVLSPRFELKWVAGQRGKPGLNADIQNAAESVRMVTDGDFEILGTNATSALCTYNAEGGITLTTAGASGDQMILAPHLDANQTPWTQTTWGTDKSATWECDISTGAAITAMILWAGLKLTNTPVVATDANQVFVRYEAGVNSGEFQVISSIADVDTTTDTNIVVAVSTRYHIKIEIGADRTAKVWINGVLVLTTAALTDAVDLIPYVGIQSAAVAAKVVNVHGEAAGRIIG